MSIFSFEAKAEKMLKEEQKRVELEMEIISKEAKIKEKDLEAFFRTKGAQVFMEYLQKQKEICLDAIRERPSYDLSLRLQERFSLICDHMDLFNVYLNRVKLTS